MCLAQGHNMAEVGIEPPTSRSGVRCSNHLAPHRKIGNRLTNLHENWYVALKTPAYHNVFKWCPWIDFVLFYSKGKFCNIGFSVRKSKKTWIFQKLLQQVTWKVFSFVSFLLNVPLIFFFSHFGTEPPFHWYCQYFWGVNVSCARTQHGGGRYRAPDLSLRSPML